MAYQNIKFGPFSGLNQDENPHALEDHELQIAEDCAARGRLVGTRPGCNTLASGEDYENALTGTPIIQGAYEFRTGFDANRTLLLVAHHGTSKLWYDDASQLPAGPTITTDGDYVWSFTTHNDLLWAAGGPAGRSQVQSEPVFTWDGNTGNAAVTRTLTAKDTGTTLYPKFIKSWNGYLLMNGLQQATASSNNNPAATRYATFATDPLTDANWPDSNTVGFNPSRRGVDSYGRSYCTGFGTYRDNQGDFLLLLFNTHIVACVLDPGNDFAVTDVIPNGCVHERAFVDLGTDAGDGIYVSEHGIHSVRQSQQFGQKEDSFLSWKIRTFWNTLNRSRIPFTTGAYDARNGRVIFAFSTGSETSHDVLMALELKDGDGSLTARNARWFGPWRIVDEGESDNTARIQHLKYMRNASDEWYVYAFTRTGRVLRFEEDVWQDLGQYGYQMKLRTKDFFGDTMAEKRIGDAIVTLGPTGTHTVTTRAIFDLGRKQSVTSVKLRSPTGLVVGVGLVGVDQIGASFVMSEDKAKYRGKGRTIAFEFEHDAASEPFLLGQIVAQVQGAGEARGDD